MPQFSDDIFLGAGATYMGTGASAATAVISATISGTTLTVVSALSGDPITVGQYVVGSGVTANSYVTANLGNSQYTLSQSSTVSSATTMYVAGQVGANGLGDPSPMSLGVGPLGRVYIWDTIPQTLQTNNIAASQTPTGAGSLTLTAGTSVQSVVRADGTTVLQLDVPRAVSATLATGGAATTITVSGYDYFGQAMTQTITTVAATTVTGLKAFYQISGVTTSGATTAAITIGTSDVLGLPVRVMDAGYVLASYNNTLGLDAGTFVPAVTATATSATGDVRGTYKPSSATSGQKRLVMHIAMPAIATGPNATRQGALGVTQA